MWTFIKQDQPINDVIICHFEKDGMERNVGVPVSEGMVINARISELISLWEAEDAQVVTIEEIV